jgi:flavin reductase (DIM6/NTAB) family NADH-FMN oxidoreductase RutF
VYNPRHLEHFSTIGIYDNMNFSSREFRDALGCFATGICVVTAKPGQGDAFGITINSFASVSLEPPLVLWSLQNNSEMYEAFESCQRWAVNVLRSGQKGMSTQYAKRGDHLLEPTHFKMSGNGIPVMPAALVSFECELEARYPGGDHTILVARVLEMTQREQTSPLVFCSGSYRELAAPA